VLNRVVSHAPDDLDERLAWLLELRLKLDATLLHLRSSIGAWRSPVEPYRRMAPL
jgi:hypothetical protein